MFKANNQPELFTFENQLLNNEQQKVLEKTPESALIKNENKYYILVLSKYVNDKYEFTKQEVSFEREQNNFVEILNNNTKEQVLIKGLYYLNINE
jgi:hypothetical protein